MKHFLPIILTFLINLPNCGMVFSGEMDMIEYHDTIEMGSMHMDEVHVDTPSHQNIGAGMINCCPNTSESSMERNTNTFLSLKNILIVPCLEWYPLGDLPKESNNIIANSLYRSNAPPDPGEYISLIGSSVKKLN